ncbi:MAG: hypothetical protein NTX25_17355, partial [Proteobacteria bacterium]|nr:hypothetical protein [Pseudomonadota bacterium]
HPYSIFSSKLLKARFGIAAAREETSIQGSASDGGNLHHTNSNLGLFMGLGLQVGGRCLFSFDWNNALFPAGVAGIFLATARKQSLSAGLGWRI